MITSTRRPWTVLLLLLALVAPAARAAGNNCADGGRARPDDGGIGGTGALPIVPDDDGGIGGTGISINGDTGIIGTITGFASICVGDVEIQYAADTSVEIDGQRATTGQLAVGQVVQVIARGTGSEVSARHIAVRHIIAGPVTRIDAERNEIEVIGQTVHLSPATRAGGSEQSPVVATAFAVDSVVQVSGMRRGDGVVVASRVSSASGRDIAQLTGPVRKLDSGVLAIVGTQVRIDGPTQPAAGDEVHVAGRWDGSAIVARSVEALPRIPFDGRVPRLDIEGYATEPTTGQLHVGPFLFELSQASSPDAPGAPAPDARIRIQAVVRDRHVIVERIGVIGDLPVPPALPDRQPRGDKKGGPSDAGHLMGEPPRADQPGPDEHGGFAPPPRDHGMMAPGVPDIGAGGAPPHPDRFDRPAPPQRPDRPDRPPPPQLPERPNRPERPNGPERPERPPIPDRPPRPEARGRP